MEMDLASIHKQFPAAPDYLASIYILQRDYGSASHSRLAEWNEVSTPAVSQAIGRLRRLGLVHQKKYENVALTEEGRELAMKVLRRHYLIEHLLVGVLGYPWDKADEEAKLLQTAISDDLSEHLYHRLGSPQTCPHGNPMPKSAIEAKLLGAPKLTEAPAGQLLTILRITEEGEQLPTMLAFCHQNGIRPGARFFVEQTDPEAVRLAANHPSVDSNAETTVTIPFSMAQHIRYEQSSRQPPS